MVSGSPFSSKFNIPLLIYNLSSPVVWSSPAPYPIKTLPEPVAFTPDALPRAVLKLPVVFENNAKSPIAEL